MVINKIIISILLIFFSINSQTTLLAVTTVSDTLNISSEFNKETFTAHVVQNSINIMFETGLGDEELRPIAQYLLSLVKGREINTPIKEINDDEDYNDEILLEGISKYLTIFTGTKNMQQGIEQLALERIFRHNEELREDRIKVLVIKSQKILEWIDLDRRVPVIPSDNYANKNEKDADLFLAASKACYPDYAKTGFDETRKLHTELVIKSFYWFVTEQFDVLYNSLRDDFKANIEQEGYIKKLQDFKKDYYDKIDEHGKEVFKVGLIFHDVGYAHVDRGVDHEEKGAELVEKYLKEYQRIYGETFYNDRLISDVTWFVCRHGYFGALWMHTFLRELTPSYLFEKLKMSEPELDDAAIGSKVDSRLDSLISFPVLDSLGRADNKGNHKHSVNIEFLENLFDLAQRVREMGFLGEEKETKIYIERVSNFCNPPGASWSVSMPIKSKFEKERKEGEKYLKEVLESNEEMVPVAEFKSFKKVWADVIRIQCPVLFGDLYDKRFREYFLEDNPLEIYSKLLVIIGRISIAIQAENTDIEDISFDTDIDFFGGMYDKYLIKRLPYFQTIVNAIGGITREDFCGAVIEIRDDSKADNIKNITIKVGDNTINMPFIYQVNGKKSKLTLEINKMVTTKSLFKAMLKLTSVPIKEININLEKLSKILSRSKEFKDMNTQSIHAVLTAM